MSFEDDAYDDFVQRLVDAKWEGRRAGLEQLSAEMCPYFRFEPEYDEWHKGHLSGLAEVLRGRKAA